jgi:hypothetical protein
MRVAFNSPARNQVWGSRSTGGPLACNQQMRVQFPPLPPISPGRPLRSRRRSEKPDKHVRLVPLAPSVTVAEWLRRQTVDLGQERKRLPTLSADKVTSTASPLVGGFNSLRSPQLCGCRSPAKKRSCSSGLRMPRLLSQSKSIVAAALAAPKG